MTRHIKNWEDLPPKLMPDGVERILNSCDLQRGTPMVPA